MREDAFRSWLQKRYPKPAVASSYFSYAQTLEKAFGDLDACVDEGRVEALLDKLSYSMTDARAGKPAPRELGWSGNPYNPLSNLRTGLRTYQVFREGFGEDQIAANAAIAVAGEAVKQSDVGRQFELERHLQETLRSEIEQLEAGLTIVDGGIERGVASGFIDILARDATGALVVIELKAGNARRDTIGQILGYMGDLSDEEPDTTVRGIIVAADFDKSCRSAVAVVPTLSLRSYRFNFSFSAPE